MVSLISNCGLWLRAGFCRKLLSYSAILAGIVTGAGAQTITTIAGGGGLGDGGPATSAIINRPAGVAIAANGNVYVADTQNNRIRLVTPTGDISTFAGNGASAFAGDGGAAVAASLNAPRRLVLGPAGDLYVADTGNHRIRRITPAGIISTVAGNGVQGFTGDGGPATSASFDTPSDLSVDSNGNIFVVDTFNKRIRRVSVGGIISTFAGNGGFALPDSGNGGPATSAPLSAPCSVHAAADGRVYIGESTSSRIRVVATDGVITTFAGTSNGGYFGDGGLATSAGITSPCAMTQDAFGNTFFDENGRRIRQVTAAGIISTIAGTGFPGFAGDGGAATAASFDGSGLGITSTGDVVIADEQNNRVRRFTPGGNIATIGGSGSTTAASGDGGPALAAGVQLPTAVVVDSAGNVYFSDLYNNQIRKVGLDGIVNVFAGTGVSGFSGDGGPAISAQLAQPTGLAVDASDNIYAIDSVNSRIRRIDPAGNITTVVGNGTYGLGGDGGPALAASLYGSLYVAIGGDGSIYIRERDRIRKVAPDGIIDTLVAPSLGNDGGIALDKAGNLYFCNSDIGRVFRRGLDGVITSVAGGGGQIIVSGPAANAALYSPRGIAVDRSGNVIFAQGTTFMQVRQVSPLAQISPLAGTGPSGFSGDGGAAANATLNVPTGIALDARGDVYVADTSNNRIRKITFPQTPRGVLSRKTHGAAGTRDIQVDFLQPVSGPVTVEPRLPGAGHTLIFEFNDVISNPGTATVANASGNAIGIASSTGAGRDLIVTISGVAENQRATISLAGVNGVASLATATIGFLVGDVNGSHSTTATDLSAIKSRRGIATDATNFRMDLDSSGTIDAADLAAAKVRAGLKL